jgi:glycosyltransferase involved in cell wall biosynthesis
MPEFFSKAEIAARDRYFEQNFKYCSRVILSSFAAKRDAEEFYSSYRSKIRVLQFVVGSINPLGAPDLHYLENKYSFNGPYFFLPNQFWIHKNHRVVIEALRILKSHEKNVLVLATGNTHDYRQPDYFQNLVESAKGYGISGSFRVLGLVPYPDLVGLIINSVALINPSLFEGWSTTVEEAKAFGKRILLSDIPVHREQAPDFGLYFPPNDPEALADLMLTVWSISQGDGEPHWYRLFQTNNQRKINFARSYETIVLDALEDHGTR